MPPPLPPYCATSGRFSNTSCKAIFVAPSRLATSSSLQPIFEAICETIAALVIAYHRYLANLFSGMVQPHAACFRYNATARFSEGSCGGFHGIGGGLSGGSENCDDSCFQLQRNSSRSLLWLQSFLKLLLLFEYRFNRVRILNPSNNCYYTHIAF